MNINNTISVGPTRVRVKLDDLGLQLSIVKRIIPNIPTTIDDLPHFKSLNDLYQNCLYFYPSKQVELEQLVNQFIDVSKPLLILKGHLIIREYPDRYSSFIFRNFNEYASHVMIIGHRLHTGVVERIITSDLFYYSSTDDTTCLLSIAINNNNCSHLEFIDKLVKYC